MVSPISNKRRSKELAQSPRRFLLASLGLCVSTLFVSAGCVSSGATAASNNVQGVEFFSSGQYDKAIAHFQDSIAQNPESAETYYNLGSAYQRKANQTGDLNLLTQAENAYWTALQLNPAPETIVCCYRGIATSSTARGDADGAMRTLEEWRDRNPDSIEPQLEIAYLLEAQGRDDDAYELLERIADAAPNDYRAYYKMGVLSERAGNIDDAFERTNAAAQLSPSNDDIARRARMLETQQLAEQRRQAREKLQEQESAQLEETLAEGEPITVQTAKVQSTSAQGEMEQVPELVLPDDSQTTPQENEDFNVEETPVSVAQPLGFGEVTLFESAGAEGKLVQNANVLKKSNNASQLAQNASQNNTSKEDSDVKWISATSSQNNAVTQTSAALPQNRSKEKTSTVAQDLTVNNSSNKNANETTNVARKNVVNENTREIIEASRYNTPTKRKKAQREIGAGMPKMKAGSFF